MNPPGRYCTRDVISDPPTSVMVVRDYNPEAPPAGDVYCIGEADVEVTEGWETRFGKSQLSICFMHSFGKCSGRCNNDPSTCHQIHIRRSALDKLRATYRNRTRSLFSRTIKAHLSDEMRQALSRFARKDLTLKYLEYRAPDVEQTDGLQSYETAYRSWLLATPGSPDLFHETCVFQCPTFATTGLCEKGERCSHIHGDVRNAQVRDHVVANALRQLAMMALPAQLHHNPMGAPLHTQQHTRQPPPSFNTFVRQMQVPQMQATPFLANGGFALPQQQPMYVILMPQQYDAMHGQQPQYMQTGPMMPFAPMQPTHPHAQQFIPITQTHPLQFNPTKPLSPGEHTPGTTQSMSPDRATTESSETFQQVSNVWGDDAAMARGHPTNTEDIFHAFRNHFTHTASAVESSS